LLRMLEFCSSVGMFAAHLTGSSCCQSGEPGLRLMGVVGLYSVIVLYRVVMSCIVLYHDIVRCLAQLECWNAAICAGGYSALVDRLADGLDLRTSSPVARILSVAHPGRPGRIRRAVRLHMIQF
jgi:hypothetical protein